MTPFFTGSEPVIAKEGKFKGTSILAEEQAKGLGMINRLTDAQRTKAVLNFSKTGNNNLTEAWKDNVVLDYAGVRGADLTADQKRQLLELIAVYVNNIAEGHARGWKKCAGTSIAPTSRGSAKPIPAASSITASTAR